MIQITDLLKKDTVFTALKAANKKEALDKLIYSLPIGKEQKTDVQKAIFEREDIISTGVGNGVAIPHCKIDSLKKNYGAFAILDEPVAFDSIDKYPVSIIFLLTSPAGNRGEVGHLKLLSHLSRLLNDSNFRDKLVRLESSEVVLAAFNQEEIIYSIK